MSRKYSVPGWKTCSTDTNCLQHPTGSQLLDRPPGVKPKKKQWIKKRMSCCCVHTSASEKNTNSNCINVQFCGEQRHT